VKILALFWLWPLTCSDFVGEVRLDLELSARCADFSVVVLLHPGCDPSPSFPAVILQSDPISGNATVVYGWSSDGQEAWTRATLVPMAGATAYDCLQEEWQPDGERGRGYDFLPTCPGFPCVTGCLVSSPEACDGRTRLEQGENCSVPCEKEGLMNLTCDGLAWPELRSTVCTAEVIFCDELNGTSPEVPCESRGSTTSSTTLAQADRRFRGCSELVELSPGVVGMPDNRMVSGAYYLEIGVETGAEVAGFVDASWSPTEPGHQWLSTPGGSEAGYIGLAVRFVGEGLAEVRFSWDGVWSGPQQLEFDEHLILVVFTTEATTWHIPLFSWRYLAPSIFYAPLTQRPFPEVCHFPLRFQMMATPPVCRDGLLPLDLPEDCQAAGFYLGVAIPQVLVVDFPGYPANCFFCQECDQGDLYFNNASIEETATETIRAAPLAAALCSDGPLRSTTEAAGNVSMFTEEFRLGRGRCRQGYNLISDAVVCERAAREMALVFDGTVALVNWPAALGSVENYWPVGCFYCPLCDTAHVFLNRGLDAGNATTVNEPASMTGPAATEAPAAVQLLCSAPADRLVTSTTSQEPWLRTLPITTTFAATLTEEPDIETTTVAETSSTLVAADAGIIYLGDVQCDDPYRIQRELEWWEEPALLAQVGGGLGGCCCLSACLWFWGICHRIGSCIFRCCGCCRPRRSKAEAKEQEELIFFNPPPGWQPTRVPGLQL